MSHKVDLFDEPLRQMLLTVASSGLSALPMPAQHVVLVCGVYGPVVNGGFEYFYESAFWDDREGPLIDRTADAFDAVGLVGGAEAVRRSATLFPPGVLSQGPGAVRLFLHNLPRERIDEHFTPLDHIVWSLNDDAHLDRALQAFAESHSLLTYRAPR